MADDERMTKQPQRILSLARRLIHHPRTFWGAHAPSRADFGAPTEILLWRISTAEEKVRDHEGVIASTRGACAPKKP